MVNFHGADLLSSMSKQQDLDLLAFGAYEKLLVVVSDDSCMLANCMLNIYVNIFLVWPNLCC